MDRNVAETVSLAFYRRGWWMYEALFRRFFFPRIRSAICSMDIGVGDLILDVGVGTGLSFSEWPAWCRVVGVDLSSGMLGEARRKVVECGYSHIRVLRMDAMDLGFGDRVFDAVFLSHVVTVVSDPWRMFSEVRRVCKPGGLVVVVNHFRSRNPLLGLSEVVLDPLFRYAGWRSDLSLEEFFEKSGLKVVECYTLKRFDLWRIVFAVNG